MLPSPDYCVSNLIRSCRGIPDAWVTDCRPFDVVVPLRREVGFSARRLDVVPSQAAPLIAARRPLQGQVCTTPGSADDGVAGICVSAALSTDVLARDNAGTLERRCSAIIATVTSVTANWHARGATRQDGNRRTLLVGRRRATRAFDVGRSSRLRQLRCHTTTACQRAAESCKARVAQWPVGGGRPDAIQTSDSVIARRPLAVRSASISRTEA